MTAAHGAIARSCAAALLLAGAPLLAQPTPSADSLRLAPLHDLAVGRDPRAAELALLAEQGRLRLADLDAERLPAVGIVGEGRYQSDVTSLPIRLADGAGPPRPPLQTYDARLDLRQPLLDPTRPARRAVERAQVEGSRARVRTALHALRQAVNDAYFAALRLQSQRDELATGIADLEAQRLVAAERVRAGAALPSEAATLEAELLRRRQTLDGLDARRAAALVVLADLTGEPAAPSRPLGVPDLAAAAADARARLGELRARPEHEQFDAERLLLDRRRDAVAARERPRVSAFGRAGYGRPGLNMLARDFDEYWTAGVQVEWAPWNRGSDAREREALALQRQVVDAEEAAFVASLRRAAAADLATMDHLERTLAADDTILALRERILAETRLRFAEGVITSAEYVDRETDVLAARLARAAHRAELAEARARFLTLVGREVR